MADDLITSIEKEYLNADLPDLPNKKEGELPLVQIPKELYHIK